MMSNADFFDSQERRYEAVERMCFQVAQWLSIAAIVASAFVLLGWLFDIELLRSPLIGQTPTSLSVAVCVATSASSFLLLQQRSRSQTGISLGYVLAIFSTVVSLAALFCGIGKFPLSFDMMVLPDALAKLSGTTIFSGVGLVCLAAAVALSPSGRHEKYLTSQCLAGLAAFLGLAGLVAAAYSSVEVSPLSFGTRIVPPVSGCLLLLTATAVMINRPHRGVVGVFTDSGPGGKLARRVLPLVLLLTLAMGYARLWLQLRLGLYDTTFGATLMVLLTMVAFSAVIIWYCRWLNEIGQRETASNNTIKASEAKTRMILDCAYDAFISIDKNSRILEWNKKAEQIFGWTRSEILGSTLTTTIIPHSMRDAHNNGMERFFSTGNGPILNRRIELTATRKDGTTIPIELAVFPIEVNEEQQFCAFLQDITSRKEAETEIRLLNEQVTLARDTAIESSRLKSEFLANMSHEIRTPMNAVIGVADLLKRTPLTGEQKRFVDLIVNSGNALLAIINDILQLSKIEAGKLDLVQVDFDLISTVESAAELLADRARQKGLTLTTFLEVNVPKYVKGDPQRLRQILLNLISNSIKFTDQGQVLVRVSVQAEDAGTANVRFSVSDTGIGMSQEGLKKLFTPFTQIDGSATRRHGGTGLGLTITKRLVELMGGDVDVQSVEGKGSTFSFQLGFTRAEVTEPEQPPFAKPLSQARVLLANLSVPESEIVKSYAGSWGINCISTTSGFETIQVMRNAAKNDEPVHLVICGNELSDMSSFKFATMVKNEPSISNTHLVLLVAIDEIGQSDKALQQGFSSCLSRPIKQSSLYDCLVGVLSQKGPVSSEFGGAPAQMSWPLPKGKYILLAEDNPVNQEVARLQLIELGFEVMVVQNGEEAVKAASDADCVMVLMDCQMPVMDGFQATKLIRNAERDDEGRRLPIVAMTAHAMERDRELCLAAGMDDYISKPVTVSRLREVVHRWYPKDTEIHDALKARVKQKNSRQTEEDKSEKSGQRGAGNGDQPILPKSFEPPKRPPEESSEIDFDALANAHGEDAAKRLAALFVSSSGELIEKMDKAIQNQETRSVRAIAHELKGASAMLEVKAMARICRQIEDATPGEDWQMVSSLHKELDSTFARISGNLEKRLNPDQSPGDQTIGGSSHGKQ